MTIYFWEIADLTDQEREYCWEYRRVKDAVASLEYLQVWQPHLADSVQGRLEQLKQRRDVMKRVVDQLYARCHPER